MLSSRSQYLKALNIPEYLYATATKSHLNAQPTAIKCLVIEAENVNSICSVSPAQEFLYKMLSAIGLQKNDILCINANTNNFVQEVSKYKTQAILLLDEQFSLDADDVFNIHHPGEILKNEQLKREAWEVLKQVKICLK
ncbi:hypothetical protein [Candidatus Thioglobus sp.]|uniref:hypothetical protein n=1 Tax=Candidatus Thioglobus sp. TaxID=2026721 RepID=UPI00262FB946|nr:hypothetical protein [Candidatus Thioglobus sp.]MDG2395217.1 hypothetical protein [Candidatus Thioglobus sp.]